MSSIGDHWANETIRALVDDTESSAELFTAKIASVSYPTCTITKTGSTTPSTQAVAMCSGVMPVVGDRVLCCWVGGEPVVIATIASGLPPTVTPPTFNPDILAPPGLALGTANSAFTSNSSYAIYLGKADRAYTNFKTRVEVMVAAASITWAEIAIATSPSFEVSNSVALTRRGYTNVAATFNSIGEKSTDIVTTGIVYGANLWLVVGSQATTPFQLQAALGGLLSASQIQYANTTRPSTMATGKAFSGGFNLAGFYGLVTGS